MSRDHPSHGGAGGFDRLLDEVAARADRFGHREHVHLTWLAVRRHGSDAAIGLICAGLRKLSREAGVPDKYHETLSRAWVEIVAAHTASSREESDFDAFIQRYPRLLDQRLIAHHYRAETLGSLKARTEWVAPDAAPFPWDRAGPPRSA
jgi:hypothetical protein